MKTNTKYIFVTGGVISGVGKGIMAASIGAILKAKGLKVSMQKCDPYFNVDAGLLNPREHGECFVTNDGAETDLDLGHYERFLDEEMSGNSIWTSGKLYKKLIDDERAGKFGGKTVQLVPHVTGLVQQTFIDNAKHFGTDVHIVEIGGTVGDLEGSHFIEAIREFPTKVGRENCLFVHVCYVPWLSTSEEFKTKPAQNSLRDLREFGIVPDMVVARMDIDKTPRAPQVAKKLATFCGVNEDAVVLMPDAKSVYEVPLNAVKGGVLAPLERFIDHGDPDMTIWEDLVKRIEANPRKEVKIGLVAKYIDIVFANEEESAAFTEGKAPEEALREIASMAEVAVVKVGKRGSMAMSGGEVARVAGRSQNVVDTTAAGDFFAGGFLYAHARGESLECCLRTGALLAGRIIQVVGTRLPESEWEEIRREILGK